MQRERDRERERCLSFTSGFGISWRHAAKPSSAARWRLSEGCPLLIQRRRFAFFLPWRVRIGHRTASCPFSIPGLVENDREFSGSCWVIHIPFSKFWQWHASFCHSFFAKKRAEEKASSSLFPFSPPFLHFSLTIYIYTQEREIVAFLGFF